MSPRAFAVIMLLGVVGCSTEPAALVITLDAVPTVVSGASIAISGRVTRTPSRQSTIVVSAEGGQMAASDTATDGVFSVTVALRTNQENTIELVATDAKGAASPPKTVVILHDDQAPRIVSMTPANQADGAPTTGTIEITFDEALVFGSGAAARLVTTGQTISTLLTLTADSLAVIVTPQADRRPNSVYVLEFDGIADVAGNAIGVDEPACFVTVLTDPSLAVSDPADDSKSTVGATGVSPVDLLGAQLAITDGFLTGVAQFTTARSYDSDDPNNVLLFLEIDIDQDATTGFESIRDFILEGAEGVGPSELRVEYVIGIDSETLDGPSYVGQYADFASFDVLETFTPAFCGAFVGFRATISSFGGDDGNFGFTVLALNLESATELTADPSPDTGHHTADFTGVFAAPEPWTSPAVGGARRIDLRRFVRRFHR